MACTVCSNLTPETLQYVESGQLATIFIDEYELSESAHSAGCAECKLLFDAISLERDRWPTGKEQSLSIVINVAVGKPVQIIWKEGLSIFRSVNDQTSKEAQDIPSVIGNAPLVPKDSDSEECLSLLQSWYLDCKDSHTLCQSKTQSVLPTRVIDVGSNLSTMANVSLAETKGAQGDYMALSYCWGDPEVHKALKTMHSNIDEFKQQIVFNSLPLTLQHAVDLARRLDFRYIWIDALCIIQDDENDWKAEAATMCDVFSRAAITIVACRSDGSSGGIFGAQKYGSCTQIPYRQTFVNVSKDYGRDHEYNVLLHQRSDLDPVHTRAWTLQEAILSTRTIFFTSQEMRWECNTCRHCQCGKLSKYYPAALDPEEVQYELYRTWRLNEYFPATSVEEAYTQWFIMYTTYAQRILTNDRDRLVALGGLARRFAEIMEAKFGRAEQYLAGIWRGSLPSDLLWCIEFRGMSKIQNRRYERPRVWRAPTWSWASMEADVTRYSFRDLQSRIQVLDASTDLAGSDLFGQVKAGPLNYLRVAGPLLRKIRFNYDAATKTSLQRSFPTISYRGNDLRQAIILIDNDLDEVTDKHLQDESQDFATLVVGYSPGGDLHESLVLKPVAGESDTFERIGMARLGPHFREPAEHKKLIEAAPHYTITLI